MNEPIIKNVIFTAKKLEVNFLLILFHFVDEETLLIWAATSFCMASV